MRSIEVQGKSVDEAIFRGLDQLGLSIDEVDIEILEEGGKRFLGIGTKQCMVRLTERDREEVARILLEQEKQQEDQRKEREERRQMRPQQDSRPPRSDFRPQQSNRDRQPDRERHQRNGNNQRSSGSREPSQNNGRRQINWGQPVDGGTEAEFLRGVLSKMGLKCQVDCFLDEQCLYMRVSGDNMGVLIGRRGDTLNALQYLTSLVANRGEGPYKRIIVDTENYRIKREETLVRLARRMAEQVKRTGKPMALEPMNPYERRVLHATLQSSPSVTTHSEGEEPHRHVVITLK